MHGLIASVTEAHHIDILINNAGIMRRYPATEISQEVLDEVMEVNFNGPFILCRDMGRYWIDNKIDGRLINIASLSTFQGGVRMAAYSSSKGAVGQLTKALSNEWAQHKIRVNAIAPGYVASEHLILHYRIRLMKGKLQIYCHRHEYRHPQQPGSSILSVHRDTHPHGALGEAGGFQRTGRVPGF